MPKFSVFILLILSCLNVNLDAQVLDSTSNVYKLSLEDLVNLEISIASKHSEKVADAPGMITAYIEDDIERYGYYSLKD